MLKDKLNDTGVKELMRDPEVIVDTKEKISSVIGKMMKKGDYSLLVQNSKGFQGLITAHQIITKDVPPTSTEAKSLLTHPPTIPPHSNLIEAIEKMWRNDLKKIPIILDEKLLGIVGFWEIVDWMLNQDEFNELKISDIDERENPVIDIREEVDEVRIEMKNKDLYKVFVNDEEMDEFTGTKALLEKVMRKQRESVTLGERKGDKNKRLSLETRSVSLPIKVKLKENDSVKKMLEEMKKYQSTYAVTDSSSMINFKDILRFLTDYKIKSTQRVVFWSEEDFDEMTMNHINQNLQSFVERYHKKFGKRTIKSFRIGVEKIRDEGKNSLYEMSAKLLTDQGDYYSKKEGWDPIKVFDGLIKALRKQIWS